MFDVHLDWLDAELATRPWFAGDDFTAADIMMSFPIEAARGAGGGGDARQPDGLAGTLPRPPAYARALATGGPYAYA
jgi:glutathione S-transferase